MKNPYGLRSGELVSVEQVSRGLACNCTCPGCGHRLEANKGDIRRPYFSHYRGSECGAGYETALHILAKEVLSERKQLLLPRLTVQVERALFRAGTVRNKIVVIDGWERFTFESVAVEQVLGCIIPDIILELQGRKLLVEIKVTHGIDQEKFEKIKALGVSTIEYDFSGANRALTKQDLKAALIDKQMPPGQGRGFWIYHSKRQQLQDQVNRDYIEQNPMPPAMLSPQTPPPVSPNPKKPAQGVLF